MKKTALFLMILLTASVVFAQQAAAQQKFALVIGNGAYTGAGMSKLANPVNDANDMAAALQSLGFTVDTVLDGNLEQMETAIIRLKNRLSTAAGSYGFFFYAGHGVQSNGINYLIPVGASIPTETSLRERAVSVQFMLGELNDAKNELNVVVLDACRNNPFAWARGGRGLSMVSNQPADSIIVFATSADSVASDGTGRNGLFTSHLLKHIKTPGIKVYDVFSLASADVSQASNKQQIPAIYSQYFGNAHLGAAPSGGGAVQTHTAKEYYDKGEAFRGRSEWDAAIREYTEAIRLEPNYRDAYNGRGIAYTDSKKDYDRAITDYTEALRIDPTNAIIYSNRSHAYRGKGDYDRAIADGTEAIRLDPTYATGYQIRGLLWKLLGDTATLADADFARARELGYTP